ncbi:hypothetical protein, partial [Mesorhizobium sp. B2-5-9]|uniref:hypothetical protein n=1 Tax=Mesorhizobium sp. B2-5-9 TaxID=2589921 RepID=UPI001AED4A5F
RREGDAQKQFLHCISPPLLVSGCTDHSGIPDRPRNLSLMSFRFPKPPSRDWMTNDKDCPAVKHGSRQSIRNGNCKHGYSATICESIRFKKET